MEQSSPVVKVLRWVAFLPAALLAAWIAWLVVAWGNRLSMERFGVDSSGFLARVFIEFISGAALGAAFVYVGAKVAPAHNKVIAYVLTAVGLVLAGVMMFPALMTANGWAIWAGVSLVVGLIGTAFAVNSGEWKL